MSAKRVPLSVLLEAMRALDAAEGALKEFSDELRLGNEPARQERIWNDYVRVGDASHCIRNYLSGECAEVIEDVPVLEAAQ